MDLEHIEDELHQAIENVESALRSLGYVEVEYMTTDELSDALEMLRWVAADVQSLAHEVHGREPISPKMAEIFRKMEEDFGNSISARRSHPSP